MRLLKARLGWLSGISLVVLGALPVLYALGLFAWQFGNRLMSGASVPLSVAALFEEHAWPFLPQLPAAWLQSAWIGSPEAHKTLAAILSSVHFGVLVALPGLVLLALGAWLVLRQAAAIDAEKRRREDRLRRLRVGQYRGPERVEPFFGTGEVAADPVEQKREAA
jgi:hypothetical protein